MRALLLRFSSFHPSRLFSTPIPRQSRSPRLDLKPAATPFSALKFVRDFSWKLPNVGFVASMAFSAGNGGSGNPDDGSGKGDDDGEDEDGNDSNLVGSWSSPKDKEEEAAILFGLWKLVRSLYCVWYHDDSTLLTKDLGDQFLQILAWPLVLFLTAFLDQLFCLVGIVLLCYYLTMGILAAALCVSVYLHCSRQLTPYSEETASNPPAGMECCICLSTREDGAVWRSLPCNHWFHSPCINSWIQINPTCPICMQDALRRT